MINAVVINGVPRSGKDTVVEMLKDLLEDKQIIVSSFSMIDCCRKILKILGVEEQKTSEFRDKMASLKDYLQKVRLPIKEVVRSVSLLDSRNHHVVVIHAREPRDIEELRNTLLLGGLASFVYTVVVNRDTSLIADAQATNHADLGIRNFVYDISIENNGDLTSLRGEVRSKLGFLADGN